MITRVSLLHGSGLFGTRQPSWRQGTAIPHAQGAERRARGRKERASKIKTRGKRGVWFSSLQLCGSLSHHVGFMVFYPILHHRGRFVVLRLNFFVGLTTASENDSVYGFDLGLNLVEHILGQATSIVRFAK